MPNSAATAGKFCLSALSCAFLASSHPPTYLLEVSRKDWGLIGPQKNHHPILLTGETANCVVVVVCMLLGLFSLSKVP